MSKPLPSGLRERLLAVAREDMDLTHAQLGARFGLGASTVRDILFREGVKREHVTVSAVAAQSHGDLKRALKKYRRRKAA